MGEKRSVGVWCQASLFQPVIVPTPSMISVPWQLILRYRGLQARAMLRWFLPSGCQGTLDQRWSAMNVPMANRPSVIRRESTDRCRGILQ